MWRVVGVEVEAVPHLGVGENCGVSVLVAGTPTLMACRFIPSMPANLDPKPEELEQPTRRSSQWLAALLPRHLGWRRAVVGTFLGVFGAVFLATLVSTVTATKLYEAVATVEGVRYPHSSGPVQDADMHSSGRPEELNTEVKEIESQTVRKMVQAQLTDADLQGFLAPYRQYSRNPELLPAQLLIKNRRVVPDRTRGLVEIHYQHPDPGMAVRIANLFADEFVAAENQFHQGQMSGVGFIPAHIVDRAVPPSEGDYASPNIPLDLGLGFLRALGCAFATAGVAGLAAWLFTRLNPVHA